MKRPCCECGGKRDEHRPVVRLAGGAVLWACRQCWKRLEYDTFLEPKAGDAPRKGF